MLFILYNFYVKNVKENYCEFVVEQEAIEVIVATKENNT